MSRKFRRRRVGVVAAAVALASLGGVDAMLVTSRGAPARELAAAVAAQATPAASSQVLASPSQAGAAGVPSAPAATVSAPPQVVETPPPVVDGVRRGNVGSAHSPQLLQQLSASPVTMPPPADAGGDRHRNVLVRRHGLGQLPLDGDIQPAVPVTIAALVSVSVALPAAAV